MRPVSERGRTAAGFFGVAAGAVCVACCLPPALALAGAVLGLGPQPLPGYWRRQWCWLPRPCAWLYSHLPSDSGSPVGNAS